MHLQLFKNILVFGVVTVLFVPACYSETSVKDPKKVESIAQEYHLFDPSPYAYHFSQEDVRYWAQKGLPEERLRMEFGMRQKIRDLAMRVGYEVATPKGDRKTAGVLSYWAERLQNEVDEPDILFEFMQLLELQTGKQFIAGEQAAESADAVTDAGVIQAMAEAKGLFEKNDYAWTFEPGDIVWYSYQGMTRAQLEKEFEAKAKVRELAKKTGYIVDRGDGVANAGDLSYWAEFLKGKTMSESQMEQYFREKVNPNSGLPSSTSS